MSPAATYFFWIMSAIVFWMFMYKCKKIQVHDGVSAAATWFLSVSGGYVLFLDKVCQRRLLYFAC